MLLQTWGYSSYLFDHRNLLGGLTLMGGTVVDWHCHKQQTMADNSTVAEVFAALEQQGKKIAWTHLFVLDMGIPYNGPIPMAEDNSVMRSIADGGKVTKNVRHMTIQTLALQQLVEIGATSLCEVGSNANRANHFLLSLIICSFQWVSISCWLCISSWKLSKASTNHDLLFSVTCL